MTKTSEIPLNTKIKHKKHRFTDFKFAVEFSFQTEVERNYWSGVLNGVLMEAKKLE